MVAPLAMIGIQVAASLAKGVAAKIGDALSTQADATKDAKQAATRKTADDFESMFLEQTFDRLSQAGGPDGPLGENGEGGAVYRSMLMKEYAAKLQKAGGVGISDQVYRQMLQMQEASRAAG